MTKVFIDGSVGTTGLQIKERLVQRNDLLLLVIDEDKRKDISARREMLNEADVAFLCLPDAAAIEAVSLIENPDTCVIDTSTAHRTNPSWTYGFPELGFAEQIKNSKRIANPGCHATGFISIVYPLVKLGILPADALVSAFSLTGYSGGGKKMIAEYEADETDILISSPGIYGLKQNHKHLPEMKKICGLANTPVFSPIVDDYYKGMATTVPLHFSQLNVNMTVDSIREALADFYEGQKIVKVISKNETEEYSKIFGNTKSGKDSLDIIVTGGEEGLTVTSLFDNLGKGASGAAIQNMNTVLGIDYTTGLVL